MLIDSVKIKITKAGENSPNYNIIINGNGQIQYQGLKNVNIKDNINSTIDNKKIVSILEKLKESGILSSSKEYKIDESSGRPYTKLSVEMPTDDGNIKTKSLMYYDDDPEVPKVIKDFENTINKNIISNNWINKNTIEPKNYNTNSIINKSKNYFFNKSKENNNMFKILITSIIAIVVIISVIFFIFLDSDDSSGNGSINYDPPQILSLSTAESIKNNNPIYSSNFGLNDPIYVYFSYSNITHDSGLDISGDISIYYQNDIVDSYTFIVNNSDELENYCEFNPTESWSLGEYKIVFSINDEISSLSATKEYIFNLYKKIPKVLILTPASAVNSYQDYVIDTIFDLGDTVFIYVEYSGINTTNSNSLCNISLFLNITDAEGNLQWNTIERKDTVGNNTHYWSIITDNTWTSNVYNIEFYLYDNNIGLGVSDNSFFIINP